MPSLFPPKRPIPNKYALFPYSSGESTPRIASGAFGSSYSACRFSALASMADRSSAKPAIAATVATTVGSYISPAVYSAVGLDPREAARAARTSPHRREVLRTAGERLTDRFLELGIIGGPSKQVWRRVGLLG